MPFPYNNLLIISAKLCHNIGYRKINSRTLEILSELIERIILRLTESAFLYYSAEQAEPYFDLDHLFDTFICKKFEIVNFLQLNHLKRKTLKNDKENTSKTGHYLLQNPLLTSPDIKNQYLKTLTGQNLFSTSAPPIIDNYSLWLSQDPIYTNLSGKMKNRYPRKLLTCYKNRKKLASTKENCLITEGNREKINVDMTLRRKIDLAIELCEASGEDVSLKKTIIMKKPELLNFYEKDDHSNSNSNSINSNNLEESGFSYDSESSHTQTSPCYRLTRSQTQNVRQFVPENMLFYDMSKSSSANGLTGLQSKISTNRSSGYESRSRSRVRNSKSRKSKSKIKNYKDLSDSSESDDLDEENDQNYTYDQHNFSSTQESDMTDSESESEFQCEPYKPLTIPVSNFGHLFESTPTKNFKINPCPSNDPTDQISYGSDHLTNVESLSSNLLDDLSNDSSPLFIPSSKTRAGTRRRVTTTIKNFNKNNIIVNSISENFRKLTNMTKNFDQNQENFRMRNSLSDPVNVGIGGFKTRQLIHNNSSRNSRCSVQRDRSDSCPIPEPSQSNKTHIIPRPFSALENSSHFKKRNDLSNSSLISSEMDYNELRMCPSAMLGSPMSSHADNNNNNNDNNNNKNDYDEQISDDEIEIEISNTEEPQTEESDNSIKFAGYVLRRSGRNKNLRKSYSQERINYQIPATRKSTRNK